jgi:succinate dehydrogenase hydrophobic membrane anchor protein
MPEEAVTMIDRAAPAQPAFTVGRGFVSWLMQRLTGLVLSVCLVIHVVGTHLLRASELDASFVRGRLSHEAMSGFYSVFIFALTYHALNGVWAVFLDFNPRPLTRRAIGGLLVIGGIAVVAFAIIVLRALTTL